MQRGVAIVGEVGVLQVLGVVLDYAFEEGEVLEVDGSADADGDLSPLETSGLRGWICLGWADYLHDGHGTCNLWKEMSSQMSMAEVISGDVNIQLFHG